MKFNRNGKLIRWAYIFEDGIPRWTSLCPLFWRVVLLSPLKVAVIYGTSPIWFPLWLIALKIDDKIQKRKLKRHWDETNGRIKEKQPNLILEFIKAKKDKVCPLVDLD